MMRHLRAMTASPWPEDTAQSQSVSVETRTEAKRREPRPKVGNTSMWHADDVDIRSAAPFTADNPMNTLCRRLLSATPFHHRGDEGRHEERGRSDGNDGARPVAPSGECSD
ncbi:hypothetical protein GUJ93_ZPchr0012g21262 [Zizania palustris]|uniref:Uncharacterized protein n=1 Tax=Zizania palustris TaxID=103762 RepID=A0A8J5WM65_ZIZPA|nr:hypothetical protein GUJ93_ZPchr0012g21262 [Zizania palustris]